MIIGYSRTSTLEQKSSLETQQRLLTTNGCEKVFSEQVSSIGDRVKLNEMLEFCRDGDMIVVTKLDRLARSISHLWATIENLQRKGVSFRVLDLGIDTSTPTGTLILTLLGGVAQFEREMMLERQREGIQIAKQQGKYKGRAPTARVKSEEVRLLSHQGMKVGEISKKLRISVSSIYRILRASAQSSPNSSGTI
ncbi:recombinase family protein [Maritalea porphyrae]|uniref:recombinase family protein n=1 Tax=Maritalea porphyrae TaxID=880732 RepID=UPI0022AE99A0|nr:recombinase family protein [Maritalea porphyrae]MCZ4272025.1 recombinase family protein [Maritalea porphyrae]